MHRFLVIRKTETKSIANNFKIKLYFMAVGQMKLFFSSILSMPDVRIGLVKFLTRFKSVKMIKLRRRKHFFCKLYSSANIFIFTIFNIKLEGREVLFLESKKGTTSGFMIYAVQMQVNINLSKSGGGASKFCPIQMLKRMTAIVCIDKFFSKNPVLPYKILTYLENRGGTSACFSQNKH